MYLLVADDLTGGNDAGIQFAKRGMDARLALSGECAAVLDAANGNGRMLVVNANTRTMPANAAASRIASIVSSLRDAASTRPVMVFKKIDSTLRGNPGVEMDAIMDGFGFSTAFLAPSYPQQGRTVVGGDLLVDGVPLHLTGFANDPLTPVRESSVTAIMRGQTRRKIGSVPLAALSSGPEALLRRIRALIHEDGAECIIFDAETTGHLAAIAEAGLAMEPRPLFMGAAGLAEALASQLPQSSFPQVPETTEEAASPVDRVFFICGSAHQATHAQTDMLAKAGIPVIRMPENFLDDPGAPVATTAAVINALEKGSAALAAPIGRIGVAGNPAEGMALSAALSSMALDVLQKLSGPPRSTALVMTGGETAHAVLERLGSCLSLHAELLPGIALCTVTGGPWDGLKAVTKAGGFGSPQTLLKLMDLLRQRARV